jgi:hypothetical protein
MLRSMRLLPDDGLCRSGNTVPGTLLIPDTPYVSLSTKLGNIVQSKRQSVVNGFNSRELRVAESTLKLH